MEFSRGAGGAKRRARRRLERLVRRHSVFRPMWQIRITTAPATTDGMNPTRKNHIPLCWRLAVNQIGSGISTATSKDPIQATHPCRNAIKAHASEMMATSVPTGSNSPCSVCADATPGQSRIGRMANALRRGDMTPNDGVQPRPVRSEATSRTSAGTTG
jgi:hypothetical protein